MLDKNANEYQECIVGNIIGNHIFGEQKVIRSGTKHFSAETKVYCIFMHGGMGHEQVRVLGKHRKSSRLVDIVIRTCYIKNFRLQKTYHPGVIKFLEKYPNGTDQYFMTDKASLSSFNNSHREIQNPQ